MPSCTELVYGRPYLSGTSAMVPITNPTPADFNGAITVWVFTVPSSGSYCWIGQTTNVPANGIRYVECAPQNLATCWPTCDSRLLMAKSKCGSHVAYTFSTTPLPNPRSGCVPAALAVRMSPRDHPDDQRSGNVNYLATTFVNRSGHAVSSVVKVRMVEDRQVLERFARDEQLISVMANRDLKFGKPRSFGVAVGPESLSRPHDHQLDDQLLELAHEHAADLARGCDCEHHSREPVEKSALNTAPRGRVELTAGLLDDTDIQRLVVKAEPFEMPSLTLSQLPWQESQVLVRVDHTGAERAVSVLRLEQFATKSAGGELGELLHVAEFAVVPRYDPFG
jgi:hypothetical protein